MFIPERDPITGKIVNGSGPFSESNGFRARFKGISGTATAGATTDIDYKLTQERYINGVRLIIKDAAFGDYIDFQVVDVENILGDGAGTVLDEFGSSWFIDDMSQTQPDVFVQYPAKIISGLYLRLKYHSLGAANVSVKANLYLHWKSV